MAKLWNNKHPVALLKTINQQLAISGLYHLSVITEGDN